MDQLLSGLCTFTGCVIFYEVFGIMLSRSPRIKVSISWPESEVDKNDN